MLRTFQNRKPFYFFRSPSVISAVKRRNTTHHTLLPLTRPKIPFTFWKIPLAVNGLAIDKFYGLMDLHRNVKVVTGNS
jgi:hypothetical protein